MKKIIIVMLLGLTLVLTGCEETEPKECEVGYGWDRILEECVPRDYNNNELYTQEEVDELIANLEDSFDAQAMNNLDERVTALESELQNYQPLEDCEIDNQITITTIAQIDLVLYGLEHSQEPLTDEEQFVFNLYTQLREVLYSELENGGE